MTESATRAVRRLVLCAAVLSLARGCDGRARLPANERPTTTYASARPAAGYSPSAEPVRGAPSSAAAGQERNGPTPSERARSLSMPEPVAVAPPPTPPIRLAPGGKRAVAGKAGVVATVEAHATRIGIEVLERGGNAVDAAVAVAFALAVTHPQAGSLGGGGFMLVKPGSGPAIALDYRETSPAAASAESNRKMLAAGARGYASAPVPGVVGGLHLAHERFGSIAWRELVAPAITLARDGHRFGARQAQVLGWHWKQIQDPTFRAIFGKDGRPLPQGQTLRQRALGATLEAVAERGPAGFYEGPTANRIDAAMKASGGSVRASDLASYRALWRQPLRVSYRGFEVHSMPPPSMGGIALATTLIQLEQLKAYEAPIGSALALHLFAEAARRSYADRRSVGADPAFVDGPTMSTLLSQLLDPRYHGSREPAVDPKRATPSSTLRPIQPAGDDPVESPETTHFSIVDGAGNAVACTTTLSGAFGAMVVPPETGFILSNALGAFSSSGVNSIAKGKRMASSMTPALVLQEGELVAVTGSPGGDTIPNTVAQIVWQLVDGRATVDDAVAAGRLHHQWQPDELRVEKSRPPPAAVVRDLEKRGHRIVPHVPQGDAHSIVVDRPSGTSYAAADPRQGGLALAARERGAPPPTP